MKVFIHVLFVSSLCIGAILIMSGYDFLGVLTLGQFVNKHIAIIGQGLKITFVSIVVAEVMLMTVSLLLKRQSKYKRSLKVSIGILGLLTILISVVYIGHVTGNAFQILMN